MILPSLLYLIITKILGAISTCKIVRDRRDNKNTAEDNPSAVFGPSVIKGSVEIQ